MWANGTDGWSVRKRFAGFVDELEARQQGFTLLELLVGMLIISILVATASHYFLQQRRKGWDAQVRAVVRNMAGSENNFVYTDGAPAYTEDLDDLYLIGFRWDEQSVRPFVALATTETFCIQAHSIHDPDIVWHFSSSVGRPLPGPATPSDCGDPEVLGSYIAGMPSETYGRDGVLSTAAAGVDPNSTDGGAGREGSPSVGVIGGSSGSSSGSSDGTGGTAFGSESSGEYVTGGTDGSGTTDGTGTGTTGGTTSGCDGTGTESGSTTGTNHPSDKDRDTESGGSGNQGSSGSDPDGDENDGADKPDGTGGANTGDQDGNNGSGNDTDFEDDNRGPDYDGTPTPGTGC